MSEESDFELFNANVREVMGTPAGRAMIWAILDECNLYADNAFEANQGTEGRRAVGIGILGMLNEADSSIYPNLLLKNRGK